MYGLKFWLDYENTTSCGLENMCVHGEVEEEEEEEEVEKEKEEEGAQPTHPFPYSPVSPLSIKLTSLLLSPCFPFSLFPFFLVFPPSLVTPPWRGDVPTLASHSYDVIIVYLSSPSRLEFIQSSFSLSINIFNAINTNKYWLYILYVPLRGIWIEI